jgi:regulation of enolase protein 1 (concanavalin A-like superfamily)
MLRKAGLLSVLLIAGLCAGAWAELISYHPFDEGSGTTAADATGNGNDGTFNGDVEWVPGVKGTAVRLDTAGERVVLGEIDPTAANNAMTLAAWINWEGSGHASITHHGIFGKRQGWDPRTYVKWFWEVQPDGDLQFRNGDTAVNAATALVPYANEWAHVAMTWDDGAVVQYINAVEINTGNITFRDTADATVVTIGCVSATNNETFVGIIDEARIYDTALTPAEIDRAMTGDTASASGPQPATGATDVRADVVLSWLAGEFAASHDVYFGMDFDNVNEASSTDGRGVLVSPGQIATSYAPDEPLELGQTYYWRVDEVNAPPDSSIAKGQVWSFTVEPYAYPLANITATASSSATQQGMTPDKTVDGSGLTGDEHSTDETTMWLSAPLTTLPAWIQYEFDAVYQLDELWVWNSNQAVEGFIGFGARDVTVEYSLDGVEWISLGDVEFARAPGDVGYTPNTTVDMAGVSAKFVRLTITSSWGGIVPQAGLSEVRFFYAPTRAREPQPTVGAEGVALDAVLSWRTGRGSASHELYVSSERAAVADGTALVTTTETPRYDLSDADPQYGRTVYWKVNELDGNGALIAEGDIWSFSTTEYAVVDDFESYTDDIEAAETIWQTWSDGIDNVQRGGSQVGYNEAPFAEQTIVYKGRQSMPLAYNNTDAPFYSEAARTWDTPQDWAADGIDTLFVHFRGSPTLFLEAADGTITMSAAGKDIWDTADEFTFAYKSLSGNGSVVVRVDSLQNTDPWAKAGVMIRNSLDPGAKNAMAYVTANSRVGWQFREIIAGTSDSTRSEPDEITLPHWVRLTRTGNVIKAEHSSDGTNWQPMVEAANPGEPTEREIPMNSTVYIGLALTSHSEGVVNTAELSGAATAGNAPGAWEVTQIGVDQSFNDRADLYVALEDSGGRSELVKHPDPDAVLQQDWQQWAISLTDFADAGVRLGAIKTIYIGVGDPMNPVADGAGLLYVDEIGVGHPGLQDPGTSGLLVYCPLENDFNDLSGNGNDGMLAGDPNFPAAFVDGAVGTGMLFDGTSGHEHVDLGTFNPTAATGQLSVSLWAKWDGLSGQWQGLIGKRDSWAADDMMWDIEANRDTGVLRFGRNGSTVSTGDAVLPEGEWEHVLVTFDSARVRIFVAGELRGSGDTFSFGTDTEANVQFGCGQVNGGNPFNGALDEVRIYNRALSSFEIKYLAGQ